MKNHLKVGSISFSRLDYWIGINTPGKVDPFGDRWALQFSAKRDAWLILVDSVIAEWSVGLDGK